MAMTREERATKEYIYQKLREEGYPTYAKIFGNLDLNLTKSDKVIGYMDPKTGTITINRDLEEDQFSVIIRHEILHNYLRHEKRLLDHLAEMRGIDPDDLDDLTLNELRDFLYGNQDFNIAADYEISNRGYTEEDKQTVRNILLNGKVLSGLVTEDQHPEWVNWDVEDMYDELLKEREQAQQDAKDDMNNQSSDNNQSNDDQSDSDNSQSSQGGNQQGDGEPQPPGNQQGSNKQSGDSGQQSGNGSNQSSNGQGDESGDSSGNSDSGDDSSSNSNQSQQGDNNQSSNSQDGGNQSSGSNQSGNNQNGGNQSSNGDGSDGDMSRDNNSSKGNQSSNDSQGNNNSKVVYGKFIDENTFVDRNGNVITIGG